MTETGAKKAANNIVWVLSFVFRPMVFLLFGIAAGYYVGFSSGYENNPDSIGMRIALAVGKVSPEAVRATRQARAAELRDTINSRSGVSAIDTIIR
ncbi:MAG TPA: hypothetical protein VIV65_05775 [Gemmatimonadaceae bacterium]|jgi:hypothetical protein